MKKILSFFLSLIIIIGIVPIADLDLQANATQDRSNNFYNNYEYSADPGQYMVNIALAQKGRSQSSMGYTEFWCANFVSDCARLAGQSDAIPAHSYVPTLWNNIINAGGREVYDRKAGDIIFYDCSKCDTDGDGHSLEHVGIVIDSTYSIEGNLSSSVKQVSSFSCRKGHTTSSGIIKRRYLRPNYQGSAPTAAPSLPNISFSQKVALRNTTVTINFNSDNASSYWIGVYKDNVLFEDKSTTENSFSVCMPWVGKYDVVVTAYNSVGDCTNYASFYYGDEGDYIPTKPVINIDKKVAKINDTVTISFSSEFANSYWIGVYKDNVLFEDKSIFIDDSTIERSFSVCMQWVGKYDVVVVAINPLGDNTSYASFYYGNDGDYVPQSFTLTGNKTVALKNEDVMVSFNADLATEYWISVYHKGQLLGDDVIQGHTFTMWYSDLGEYNVKVVARNDCSSTDAKYFNFVVVDQKSFTIQYDSNGGENTPVSDVKIYGEEYTLSNQYPTKPGYKFSGWNTKADGSGVSYSAGDVYDKNEDLILYALWSRFAAKEGSTAVIDGSYIYGLKTKLTAANIKNTFLDYEGVEVTLTKAIEDARYYGTGSTVTVKYSDGTEEVYTIIIFGDIDGNAIIDSDDAFSVLEASYDNSLFNAAQKKAANVDGVRRISIDDYSIINDAALGISEIDQTAV